MAQTWEPKYDNPFNKPESEFTEDEKEYMRLLPTLPEGKYVLICQGKFITTGDTIGEVMAKLPDIPGLKKVLARPVSRKPRHLIMDAIEGKSIDVVEGTNKRTSERELTYYFENVQVTKNSGATPVNLGLFKIDSGAVISTLFKEDIARLDLLNINTLDYSGFGGSIASDVYFCSIKVDRNFFGAEVIPYTRNMIGTNIIRHMRVIFEGLRVTGEDLVI